MHKRLLTLILILFLACKGFAQYPPVLNSYAYSSTSHFINMSFNYTPNDTGTIKAQVQLATGVGDIFYDSIFLVPATITQDTVRLGPVDFCTNYLVFFNLSSAHAYGTVNQLSDAATSCVADGINEPTKNTFNAFFTGHALQIASTEIEDDLLAEVYDVTGRKISSTPVVQTVQQIKVAGGTGVYFLNLKNRTGSVYTTRFLVN